VLHCAKIQFAKTKNHPTNTLPMPILPAFALFVILQSWSFVLSLVSAVWTEYLLARYQGHWLVRLRDIADLRAIEQACAGFHADSGRGAPVVHSIPQLVRALLVKYLLDLSLRATEVRISLSYIFNQTDREK
jgi:hypothetical protein